MRLFLLFASCALALRVGPPMRPLAPHAALAPPRAALPRMQSFIDEYVESDPETGETKSLSLGEKEKKYLDCLDAYYNEGGQQLLPNAEYEQLKLDLDFEGARVTTFSADEIKFVLANKRYNMGKPILDDKAYDALRKKLRDLNSVVVLHDTASCNVDGICKNELRVDNGKTRLLYLPGFGSALVLLMEASFWTLHLDPIFSIVLFSIPAYFGGNYFTENIFAQKPLVAQSSCPSCNYLVNVYFGDLFGVQTDFAPTSGGKVSAPGDTVELKCPNCKEELIADRGRMIISTVKPKGQK